MKSNNNLYIFVNGHGENAIGLSIIKKLKGYSVSVFPFVGDGKIFKKNGVRVLFEGRNLPSGGLLLREGLRAFYKDLKNGFIINFISITKALSRLSKDKFTSLIIGDFYPLIMVYIFLKRKSLFILSSKSARIKRLTYIELFLLKHAADKIFVRDISTKKFLIKKGIEALYMGNPIVGGLKNLKGHHLSKDKKKMGILFLPGSREDVYRNITYMLKIVEEIIDLGRIGSFKPFFHLSNGTDIGLLFEHLPDGWKFERGDKNLIGRYIHKIKGVEVSLYRGIFSEALNSSHIVVGLSGTANEQSVALGRPVIAFPISGTHATDKRFTKRQAPLLGENLVYFPEFDPYLIAKKILKLASDKRYLKFLMVKGRETVGKDGIISIVRFLNNHIKE